jgi:hypothetical protein
MPTCASLKSLCDRLSLLLDFEGTPPGQPLLNRVDKKGPLFAEYSGLRLGIKGWIGNGAELTGPGLSFSGEHAGPSSSFACWIKANWLLPCGSKHTFGSMLDSSGKETGPSLNCDPDRGGGVGLSAGSPGAYVPPNSPSIRSWGAGWVHLVATWSDSPAPVLLVDVNGSKMAGDSRYWAFPTHVVSFFVGGTAVSPPDAVYDEVALWKRALTEKERTCVHQLGVNGLSLTKFCGLN